MMPSGYKRRRGAIRYPHVKGHKPASRAPKRRNRNHTWRSSAPAAARGSTTLSRKTVKKDEQKDDKDDEHSGFFDTRIKALSTKKNDIEQCFAAEQKIVPAHPFRMLLSGASGSGKSTVLLNLLKRFYVRNDGSDESYFDKIYAIGPTVKFDDLWKELDLPDDQLVEKPTTELLEKIYGEQESQVKQKGIDNADKVCIVFEDIISHAKFMRSKEFLKAYVMGRHYGISTMVCTQSFTKVPRACRLQCTHVVFFPSSQSEMMLMNEEFCPPRMSKKDFMQLMAYATTPDEQDEYPFLYIDHPAKPQDRFRKTFGRRLRFAESNDMMASLGSIGGNPHKNKRKHKPLAALPALDDDEEDKEEDEEDGDPARRRLKR